MQFHLNGFRPGDPAIRPARAQTAPRSDEVDVLIVGCGPAGLCLAAQLSAFPDLSVRIVEAKSGPLEVGQADGVACRTMEMFQAFGFAEKLMKEAYWVNETSFWRPDPENPEHIVRGDRILDTEPGLSEFPHVILNQARVHDFFLEVMKNAPSRLVPDYSRRFAGMEIDCDLRVSEHPVTVTLEKLDGAAGETETVRAKYVVGCDGARSAVRKAMGRELKGDSANKAWGVMDILAVTDFPDIRLKATVHSASEGSSVVIPREGGYMVRLYIELDQLKEGERVSGRSIEVDDIIAAANRIFSPYSFDVKEVAWWSVYEIGQRLCERFDDLPLGAETGMPRAFIAGDACHTHSPKAGQGMNVSLRDAFNLGWKLASVLRGQADASLLRTYSEERQKVAKRLIDFDRELAQLFNARKQAQSGEGKGVDPEEFQKYFQQHGRYTAGTAIRYEASLITHPSEHQRLASGFEVGTRFHSAPVIRLADAKPVQLGHTIEADGRWRLFLFAPHDGLTEPSDFLSMCSFLANDPQSPLRTLAPEGADIDAAIDVRAILQTPHREVAITDMPDLLFPAKGPLGLRDYEKVFCVDPSNDIFDLRGVDRSRGAAVLVRPDQHVATVLALSEASALVDFFAGILRHRRVSNSADAA